MRLPAFAWTLGFAVLVAGQATPEDLGKVPLETLKVRAEAADRKAEFEIGSRSDPGPDSASDRLKAFCWYHRAAMHGSAIGGDMIGMMYALGSGTEKNLIESYAWFYMETKSAAPSTSASPAFYKEMVDDFSRDLAEVTNLMTPQQINQGKKRGEELMREFEAESQRAQMAHVVEFARYKPAC